MIVIIDGKHALIKKDTEISYTSENPDFDGREGYTMTISFPLEECPENLEIFGNLNRPDAAIPQKIFSCQIIAPPISLSGVITIVKISDNEVECQFATGKSATVLSSPWEDIYINEMDLGRPAITNPDHVNPSDCARPYNPANGVTAVCLPWINTDYPLVPNNWRSGSEWAEDVTTLSWQPYLLHIVKKICECVGYTYDLTAWENSPHASLIICNSLPGSWDMPEYAKALPHWNLDDFFEQLERFLSAKFEIDHLTKSIQMRYNCDVLNNTPPVCLEDVVDSFTTDVAADDEDSGCRHISHVGLKYKDTNHQRQDLYNCDWFMRQNPPVKRYGTIYQLTEAHKLKKSVYNGLTWFDYGDPEIANKQLLYAADVDTYFILRSIDREVRQTDPKGRKIYNYLKVLEPVNLFGSWLENDDNALEVSIVPVCIDDTYISKDDNKGRMMFLTPGSTDENTEGRGADDQLIQPRITASILRGEENGGQEFYSEIYVAYVANNDIRVDDVWLPFSTDTWPPVVTPGHSLRLAHHVKYWKMSQAGDVSPSGYYAVPDVPYYTKYLENLGVASYPKVDPSRKYSFSWLGSDIPNPRAVFYIRGRRYVCEKITASFTPEGDMSQLLKGEFWPIMD